jgi:hypothetical protein
MPRRRAFSLVFDPDVKRHLNAIESEHHSMIREMIETHLTYEPESETRNRKPLIQPAELEATWELRFGPNNRFRVFYSTDQTNMEVRILAIGLKERNRLAIGGEEIQL